MLHGIGENLKGKGGFTLIEVMITTAIVAILTGLTTVGIYGYLLSSYTNRVNETAKTVFFASQAYILEQKQLGKLEKFNEDAEAYGRALSEDVLLDILSKNIKGFDKDAYKDKYNTDTTRYILYEKGSGGEANPLRHIVGEYVQDPKLLENACLMEYDTKTGVVRAVFYSEKTDTFRYGGDENDNGSVVLRTPDILKAKRQGYYGVDTTGRPYSEVYVEDPQNVMLINRDRLYLEWEDINMANPEITDPGLLDALVYDIGVYRVAADGNRSDLLFKLKDIEPSDTPSDITIDQADDGAAPDGYRLARTTDALKKSVAYRLILDDIHHSIYEIYGTADTNASAYREHVEVFLPVEAGDTLTCEVTAKLDEDKAGLEAYSLPVSSNRESANFGGGDKYNSATAEASLRIDVGGSGRIESGLEGNAYTVAYARHFNNMRHADQKSCYSQTASIDWAYPEGALRLYDGRFDPVVYQDKVSALDVPFEGKYIVAKDTAGAYFSLDNLSIDKPSMQKVGIFSQNKGTIEGLTMGKPSVTGSFLAGIVAGENSGEITNITITEGSVTGSHFLGGVTGQNLEAGSLGNIQADADVSGAVPYTGTGAATNESRGWYVGGIAGLNRGKAQLLSSALLGADGKPRSPQRKVTGTKQVGGIFGANLSAQTISNLVNNSLLVLSDGVTNADDIVDIGGIAGQNGDGELSDCVNYGLIEFDKKGSLAGLEGNAPKNIGGIAGSNTGSLLRCSNELTNASTIENLLKTCTDSAHLKAGKLPEYLGKYVGGIAGLNGASGRIKDCKSKGAVLGCEVVGGLVGKNLGSVAQSFSSKMSEKIGGITGRAADKADVSGLVVGSGNMVGGIFGYNTGLNIEGYHNSAHVFGNGVTGGITGFNGVAQDDGDEKILNLISGMGTQGTPDYYAKLLGIENLPLTGSPNASISNCRNEGFVYALKFYSGGIVGINYGRVKNCDTEFVSDERLADINKLGKADCVGGIAGYNTNSIDGTNLTGGSGTAAVELSAHDFVGGVTGLNKGVIKGYDYVSGNIYGKGDCVGGLIGLNNNSEEVVSGLTRNEGMKIEGGFFTGGIVGCNVTLDGSKPTKFAEITTAQKGTIEGEAYVGGILGYNTYGDLPDLFSADGELTKSKKEAYSNTPSESGGGSEQVAVFSSCVNYAQVKANRYVGGIMGYNSALSQLWVNGCYNYGELSILDRSKTAPSGDGKLYYYIGGITGRNSKDGVINHSSNDGSVQSPSTYLGGICEVNEGWVQYCSIGNIQYYVDDKKPGVEGDNSVGGIVGLNRGNAKVISCQANEYAQIKGGNDTGGLVGTNEKDGQITDKGAKDLSAIGEFFSPAAKERESVTHAYVNGKKNTGGIVGKNSGIVENILVEKEAQIIGTQKVGGFIGYNEGTIDGSGDKIIGLVNRAKLVQGDNEVGGIVGGHTAKVVESCINTGEVVARDKTAGTEAEPGYAGGIVGLVAKDVTVKECVNYGRVVSNYSAAGGIAGYNQGTVQNSRNYGSVAGSTKRLAETSVIGGVVGHNAQNAKVLECASRDKKRDPDGAKNNPYFNDSEPNKIVGCYRVGGIIGYNDRAVLLNKEAFNREVDITVETARPEGGTSNRSYIGGVIGNTDNSSDASCTKVLKDYIFSGVIRSEGGGSGQQQCIGGIVGTLKGSKTLENCLFTGKIEGVGNNLNTWDNCGIGGLAGEAAGKIIVYPDKSGIYASNTKESLVSGAKRVGGVAGEIGGDFEVILKNDGTVAVDKYYVNLATVQGGKGVGGFYGHVGIAELSNLENRGTVKPLNVNGNAGIGGIAGYAVTDSFVRMKNCRNLGIIGSVMPYSKVTVGVGGLVGNWSTNAKSRKTVTQCFNGRQNAIVDGAVNCGAKNIGGLFGDISNADIADDCKNWGELQVDGESVGGIAGIARNCVIGERDKSDAVTMNYGSIIYMGKVRYVGGIAGNIKNGTQIWRVANEGSFDATRYVQNYDWTICGGIVGYADVKNGRVVGCVNKGKINAPRLREAGGIVGKLNSANNTVVAWCVNEGDIISPQSAGGIVGFISSTSGAQVHHNENWGELHVRRWSGGLYGQISSSAVTISDDANGGIISGIGETLGGFTSMNDVGGCVGIIQGTQGVSIRNMTNVGEIRYDYREDSSGSSMDVARIGGIIGGCANVSTMRINQCRNMGAINIQTAVNKSIQNIGGIIGLLDGSSIIGENDTADQRTSNEGDISASGKSKNIGGIAGYSMVRTKVMHAQNSGAILADEQNSSNVGGIAGMTEGLIYSCQTAYGGQIRGYEAVGGLVGQAVGANCKITSIGRGTKADPDSFDLSCNTMKVSGSQKVGGLIGASRDATIYNLYNKGEVTLNKRATGEKDMAAAGGVLGYAGAGEGNAVIKGVIASCYNLAPVKFAGGSAGNNYYIGGVIGYRSRQLGKQDQAVFSVIDCYDVAMESGGVARTTPPTAMREALWEIGNEPRDTAGQMFSDPDDYEACQDKANPDDFPWRTDEKFQWNEESYKKMCGDAGIAPRPNYASPEAVLEIMQHYKGFRLPVPPMDMVIGNEGFSYTFPFRQLAGFYTKVGYKLYDGDLKGISEEDLKARKPFAEQAQITTMDQQTVQIKSKLNYKDRIGKVVSVAAYAEGHSMGTAGELHYTSDSALRIVQRFVMMPPLPTPVIKLADVQDDDVPDSIQKKVKFEITNWAEYEKAAADVYDSLKDLKGPDGSSYPVYDRFLKGLTRFEVEDFYMPSQNGNVQGSDFWNLTLDGAANTVKIEVGTDGKATFKIDYNKSATFDRLGAANPWHKWKVQAIAANNANPLDPDAAGFTYRYLNSDKFTNLVYRLRTKLPSPTQLQVEYSAGTDPADDGTPAYVMKWTAPASKTGIKGYRVEISKISYTGADGVPHTLDIDLDTATEPFKREVSGASTLSVPLAKQELKAVVADYLNAKGVTVDENWWNLNQPKFSLTWRVISTSADDAAYIESAPSAENTFELIRRAKPVENINVVRQDDRVNDIDISWTDPDFDAANPQNNSYRAEYAVMVGDAEMQRDRKVIAGTAAWDQINLTGDLSGVGSFDVKVNIVKLGIAGKNLDSEPVEATKVIGKKLDPLVSINGVEPYKIETDEKGEEYVYYDVRWTGPATVTADNCEGYRIEALLPDGSKEIVSVAGCDAVRGTVSVKLSACRGQEITFYVAALGKSPVAGDSDAISRKLQVPDERLAEPELKTIKLSVSANNIDGGNGTDTLYNKDETPPGKNLSVAKDAYETGFEYTVDYSVIATAAVSGTHVELLCEGNMLSETDVTASPLTVSANAIDQAGKKAALKLYNRTADAAHRLPSSVVMIEFFFPKVQLKAPEIVGFNRSAGSGAGVYHVEYNQESGGAQDETSLRKGQTVRILKEKADGSFEAVRFRPTDQDGNGSGPETDSLEIGGESGSQSFHFKFPASYTADELQKMKLSICSMPKEGGAEEEKYGPSLAAERGFSSVTTVTKLDESVSGNEILLPEDADGTAPVLQESPPENKTAETRQNSANTQGI